MVTPMRDITGAERVAEIEAEEHDLLVVAMDETVAARRQIRTWNRMLDLAEEKTELLGLDRS